MNEGILPLLVFIEYYMLMARNDLQEGWQQKQAINSILKTRVI